MVTLYLHVIKIIYQGWVPLIYFLRLSKISFISIFMKKVLLIISILIIILIICALIVFVFVNNQAQEKTALIPEQEDQIAKMIEQRRQEKEDLGQGSDEDPFGEDGIARILFIGLDNRVGETAGHCDAIQLIEINKNNQTVTITAVPRGTYAPLPGTGHPSTDYYVSKSCEIGGLDYGVEQIEKILGTQADYVVFMGFSQAMGIFRQLDMPASETMQWLRLRQGYAIGEPQRARNHSTFLKQMIIKFSPELNSSINIPLGYILYNLIRTDLSFDQGYQLAQAVYEMDIPNNPEHVILAMRPPHAVQDVAYDEEHILEYINKMVQPVADIIPEGAYTGQTEEEAQQKIINTINEGLDDPEFVTWAYENYLWLQINDDQDREQAHLDILEKYLATLEDQDTKFKILTDYIIENEDLGKEEWSEKGKALLEDMN